MAEHKKKLLVLPELFPEKEGDWRGVFVLDYLESVLSWAVPEVLYIRWKGDRKGEHEECFAGKFRVIRYVLSSSPKRFLKPFYYLMWFVRGMQLASRFKDVDLIHAHGAILNGTLAWLISRRRSVPFMLTEHTGPFSSISDSWWKRMWTRFVMQKADVVLAVSDHLKKEITEAGIRPEKIVVTGNPVDTGLFQPVPGKKEQKNMLFVSRLDEFKGGYRTLQAFHAIQDKIPGWKLTIGGIGEEYEKICAYVAKHGLEERVDIRGYLTKREYALALRQADFFIFPSRHESFGLVAAEAISAGVPVIAANNSAMAEYVGDENGMLIPPDDSAAIISAVKEMTGKHKSYDPDMMSNSVSMKYGFSAFGGRLREICYEIENKI